MGNVVHIMYPAWQAALLLRLQPNQAHCGPAVEFTLMVSEEGVAGAERGAARKGWRED